MFGYVFMKVLEGRPGSYDARFERILPGRMGKIRRAVLAHIPPTAHVLDIGCGTGTFALLLVRHGCTVLGIDKSPAMLNIARATADQTRDADRARFETMSVDGMDALHDTFDVITSTLAFSELSPNERAFALKHARRLLKPGGVLIVADEVVADSSARRLAQSAMRVPAVALTFLVTGRTTHPLADLAGEVQRAGFEVCELTRSQRGTFGLLRATVAAEMVS